MVIEMNEKKHSAVMEKISSGIEGFDDITGGGLPLGRTTLLMGGPGCGKTVLALQMLVSATHPPRDAGHLCRI
jgi:circadian clock protein KaiC